MEINYDCYTQRMAQSMWDKNWWVDKIDASIDTIIDFGCGDAELGKFIEHIFPNRFRYIGIDNDEGMRRLAEHNYPDALIGASMEDIPEDVNPDTTIIIMNSVVHELFNYCSESEMSEILLLTKFVGARYIAIRDMCKFPITIFSTSLNDKALAMMKEIYHRGDESIVYLTQLMMYRPELDQDHINLMLEYVLKYRYKENWERELKERYLWDWYSCLTRIFRMGKEELGSVEKAPEYGIHYHDSFYIPFIYDTFKADFGMDMLQIPSHKKVLYERTDKEY